MALSDHGNYSGVVDIARNGIDEVIRLKAQAKADDALILQLVEALERAKKHHFTTSLPLVIENYGSKIKCANEGSIVWRGLAPAAITAARARLQNT